VFERPYCQKETRDFYLVGLNVLRFSARAPCFRRAAGTRLTEFCIDSAGQSEAPNVILHQAFFVALAVAVVPLVFP
jgi:hypothetical protein